MQPNRETTLCRYRYDPLDRLVDCTPSAQSSTWRFYLKDRLATEVQGTEHRSIMQHKDLLLAQQYRQDGNMETRLLVTDQQRSVLNVLDITRPHPLAYTPNGHRPAQNGLLSLLGFNGERPDPVTGWYLLGNGYRAFNPMLMRFNSPDSWSPFGAGGLNAYGYCVGDPVNRTDPTGHVTWASIMAKHFPEAVNKAKSLPRFARLKTLQPVQENISNAAQITLNDLPNEMIDKIADYIPGKDLKSFAQTSNRMHDIAKEESRHQSFLKFIDTGKTPQERLMRLDAVGAGSVPGILPSEAVKTGYTQTEARNLIAEINRRHYLPTIERVEAQRRAERLERDVQFIRTYYSLQ